MFAKSLEVSRNIAYMFLKGQVALRPKNGLRQITKGGTQAVFEKIQKYYSKLCFKCCLWS